MQFSEQERRAIRKVLGGEILTLLESGGVTPAHSVSGGNNDELRRCTTTELRQCLRGTVVGIAVCIDDINTLAGRAAHIASELDVRFARLEADAFAAPSQSELENRSKDKS